MKLNPPSVDPNRLLKPTSVAKHLGVHPSMVTHWMQGGTLDFMEVDGVKFIPSEAVAVLEALRVKRLEEKNLRLSEITEPVAVAV